MRHFDSPTAIYIVNVLIVYMFPFSLGEKLRYNFRDVRFGGTIMARPSTLFATFCFETCWPLKKIGGGHCPFSPLSFDASHKDNRLNFDFE